MGHQHGQICERATRDPTESIYKAPAALEDLLPNHCPSVSPDDLTSTETEEQQSEIPKR